jgi:DNA-binding transcriptional LysR family regulator
VPTPRALELRGHAGQLVREAEAVLRPVKALDLKRLVRTFTLRNRGGFVENFGPALITRISEEAPGVRLLFVPKLDKESTGPLRDGSVDLETGVVGVATGPEVRAQALFRDRYVGVARMEHPLSRVKITPELYAAARHILISHRGLERFPIDDALEALGLKREIATTVGGYSEALALVRGSDLIASVAERYTGNLRDGLFSFPLPISLSEHTVSMLWHPRMDADPAHRWLRGCVRDVLRGGDSLRLVTE